MTLFENNMDVQTSLFPSAQHDVPDTIDLTWLTPDMVDYDEVNTWSTIDPTVVFFLIPELAFEWGEPRISISKKGEIVLMDMQTMRKGLPVNAHNVFSRGIPARSTPIYASSNIMLPKWMIGQAKRRLMPVQEANNINQRGLGLFGKSKNSVEELDLTGINANSVVDSYMTTQSSNRKFPEGMYEVTLAFGPNVLVQGWENYGMILRTVVMFTDGRTVIPANAYTLYTGGVSGTSNYGMNTWSAKDYNLILPRWMLMKARSVYWMLNPNRHITDLEAEESL